MAEAIGVASGLLTLAVFAFESSVSLSNLVDSFKTTKKVIRQLREELEALNGVLRSLQQVAVENGERLSGLNLPLFRCGRACKEFEEIVTRCTAHSGGSRTSFRDWTQLQYMGNDINGFKEMLAGYKSTINIALAEANFRTVAITANVLKEYIELITNTTSDLQDHLADIDTKLQALSSRGSRISEDEMTERERAQEEKESTKQCLAICAQVSKHIRQVNPLPSENASTVQNTHQVVTRGLKSLLLAKQVTANALDECQEKLTVTASDLERNLQQIETRLRILPHQGGKLSAEDEAERVRVQEEKESIQQCLNICVEASQQAREPRTHVFEDVSSGNNSHQIIVATLGDLVSAKHVVTGDSGAQWLGQMSDKSLQELTRARRAEKIGSTDVEEELNSETIHDTKFAGNYGAGYRLK